MKFPKGEESSASMMAILSKREPILDKNGWHWRIHLYNYLPLLPEAETVLFTESTNHGRGA